MKKWKCSICKYVHKGESPADSCPVCGAEQDKFDLMDAEPVPEAESTAPSKQHKQWKCVVCGYIHTGEEPPEVCPVCGADKSQFVLLESIPEIEVSAETTSKPQAMEERQGEAGMVSRLAAQLKLLTNLHGHPIAVHIPNGVLPLTVIFTLLAVAFKSEPMAIAAKLNVWFVAVSMPAVIFTGMVDWHNRFAGRISPVFRVKFVCGALVTLLTTVIGLWWIITPEVYMNGNLGTGIFCLLNIADLIIAAVAGFYGGKLVFNSK